MPFKSKKQLGYLAEHKDKIGGEEGFHEWLSQTDVKDLPKKAPKKKGK